MKAGAFAITGGVLTFFGFMHGDRLGIGQSPTLAVSYLIVGGLLLAASRLAIVEKVKPEPGEEAHTHTPEPSHPEAQVPAVLAKS